MFCNSLPNDKILESSKLKKEFADDNFEFDENGRKLSKWGRKHCGNTEKLLVMSNFSFFHSVSKRFVLQTSETKACLGKG